MINIKKYNKHIKYIIVFTNRELYLYNYERVKKTSFTLILLKNNYHIDKNFYINLLNYRVSFKSVRFIYYNQCFIKKKFSILCFIKLLRYIIMKDPDKAQKIFFSLNYNLKLLIIKFVFYVKRGSFYSSYFKYTKNNVIYVERHILIPIFATSKWYLFYKFILDIIRISYSNHFWSTSYILNIINYISISDVKSNFYLMLEKSKEPSDYSIFQNTLIYSYSRLIGFYFIIKKKIFFMNDPQKHIFLGYYSRRGVFPKKDYQFFRKLQLKLDKIELDFVYSSYAKKRYSNSVRCLEIIVNKIVICIRKYIKHNIYKKVILLSKQNILRKTVLGFLKNKPLFFKYTKHNLKNVYIRFRKIHQIKVSLLLLKTYLKNL